MYSMLENRRTSTNGACIMIIDGISLLLAGVVFAPLLTLALCVMSWRWTAAQTLMGVAFAAAATGCIAIMLFKAPSASLAGLHFNALVSIMLLLISFIAWLVLRYAATNFAQDDSGKRFLSWFSCTVFAVMCVLVRVGRD